MIVKWLNCGAFVIVPNNAHVLHLSHLHPHPRHDAKTKEMWKRTQFNKQPEFALRGGKIVDAKGVVDASCQAESAYTTTGRRLQESPVKVMVERRVFLHQPAQDGYHDLSYLLPSFSTASCRVPRRPGRRAPLP